MQIPRIKIPGHIITVFSVECMRGLSYIYHIYSLISISIQRVLAKIAIKVSEKCYLRIVNSDATLTPISQLYITAGHSG